MTFVSRIVSYIASLVWPLVKWLLHLLTGRGELVRVCSGHADGATATATATAAAASNGADRSHAADAIEEDIELVVSRQLAFEQSLLRSRQLAPFLLEQRHLYSHVHGRKLSVTYLKRDFKTDADADAVFDVIERVKGVRAQFQRAGAQAAARGEAVMRGCIKRMIEMNRVVERIDALRQERFDEQSAAHQTLLRGVWAAWSKLLPEASASAKPAAAYQRKSKEQWQQLGFQGADPVTDLRAAGVLALRNLAYFSTQYPRPAAAILKIASAGSPTGNIADDRGFSFAIGAINFTEMLFQYLSRYQLTAVFHRQAELDARSRRKGVKPEDPRTDDYAVRAFNDLYCKVLALFAVFWKMSGATSLQFEAKNKEFFTQHLEERFEDGSIMASQEPTNQPKQQ